MNKWWQMSEIATFFNFKVSPKYNCSSKNSEAYYSNVEYHPRYACKIADL